MSFNFQKYFPLKILNEINKYMQEDIELEEIRIRNNRPVILKTHLKEIITSYMITSEDIVNILERVCDNSIYSYQNQICNGYITIMRWTQSRYSGKFCNRKWKSN